jgi:hypothetical protein
VTKRQPASLVALLDLGANTESLDEAGFTALDQAALDGETAMAQTLLDRGAKVRLPAAIALNRKADIDRLLQKDPGTLKQGGRWRYLIVRAAERAPGEVIETLIQAGADVNIFDDVKTAIDNTSGFTALHAASWHGNLSAIEALMKHGAEVTARETKWHGTPAGWADYAGRVEARDIILRGPVDMIEAIQYGLIERAKAVLDGSVESPIPRVRAVSLGRRGLAHSAGLCGLARPGRDRTLADRARSGSVAALAGRRIACGHCARVRLCRRCRDDPGRFVRVMPHRAAPDSPMSSHRDRMHCI